jgi:hypothetical protein
VAEQVTGHFDHHFVNNSPLVRSLDISSTDFILLTEDRVGFVKKNRVLQQGKVNALRIIKPDDVCGRIDSIHYFKQLVV